MLSKPVIAGINEQIAKEFSAAYLYLSMNAHFEVQNLPGFAHWMRLQYQEEVAHALRLFDFLTEHGARVELQAIEKPPTGFKSPLAVMEDVLKHEQRVTAEINKLYELADAERDYPAQLMLQWFITEQTEEEKSVSDIISRLKLAGESGPALLMLDRELAGRTAGG